MPGRWPLIEIDVQIDLVSIDWFLLLLVLIWVVFLKQNPVVGIVHVMDPSMIIQVE